MSYQLSFAWKASLTRTPPPICTSAPGSKTALVLKSRGRRELLNEYTKRNF